VSCDLLREEAIKARSLNIPRSRFKASKGLCAEWGRRRTTICQKLPKDFELSAVHHQPEEDGKFSDGANCQCRLNGYLSRHAA
jgi:hypothetical protein